MTAIQNESERAVKGIARIGLLSALAVVAIAVFRVPGPGGNVYFHLGETVMITSAVFLGKRGGGFIGGVSGAVADILLGAALWAPFSLLIHGLKGWIIGAIADGHGGIRDMLAMWVGVSVMIIGYTLTAGLLYGPGVMPVEFIGDLAQGGIGVAIAFAVTKTLTARCPRLARRK